MESYITLIVLCVLIAIFTHLYDKQKYNKMKLIDQKAPLVFTTQLLTEMDFKNLNPKLKANSYYILRTDKSTKNEVVQVTFEPKALSEIYIEKRMLYIYIKNDNMDTIKLEILDKSGKQVSLKEWTYHNICRNQDVGIFVDFYERPNKIYVYHHGIKLEYNICDAEGSIEAKIKNKV